MPESVVRDQQICTKARAKLEEAIQGTRQSLDATPGNHPERAGRLNNLGVRLGDRYFRTGAMADLEEAIQVTRQSLDATPDDHPERAGRLNNLGVRLGDRYSQTGAMAHLEEAVSCDNLALRQVTSPINIRIRAGKNLVMNSVKTFNWKLAFEASSLAISLVPKIIPRSLENSDKQHTLSQVAGLAPDASAVALNSQQPPLVALQLLEQGRGLFAASAYEMRMDIMNLQEADPVLAEKFIAVREQLQSPIVSETNIEQTDRPSRESQSDHRHKADEQFEKLVAEIRDKQGFENFLGARSLEEMQDAAASGPIAVMRFWLSIEFRSYHYQVSIRKKFSTRLSMLTLGGL